MSRGGAAEPCLTERTASCLRSRRAFRPGRGRRVPCQHATLTTARNGGASKDQRDTPTSLDAGIDQMGPSSRTRWLRSIQVQAQLPLA
jgi:hypothetical protein